MLLEEFCALSYEGFKGLVCFLFIPCSGFLFCVQTVKKNSLQRQKRINLDSSKKARLE